MLVHGYVDISGVLIFPDTGSYPVSYLSKVSRSLTNADELSRSHPSYCVELSIVPVATLYTPHGLNLGFSRKVQMEILATIPVKSWSCAQA